MRNRFTLTLLAMIFLLSTTAGLVEHDHGLTVVRKGYDCTSDHREHTLPPNAEAGLQKSGHRHHHDCLGCQLSGNRTLVPVARGCEVGPLPAPIAIPASQEAPTVSKLPTNLSLRGPPRA
jgi:hypothetical protein